MQLISALNFYYIKMMDKLLKASIYEYCLLGIEKWKIIGFKEVILMKLTRSASHHQRNYGMKSINDYDTQEINLNDPN